MSLEPEVLGVAHLDFPEELGIPIFPVYRTFLKNRSSILGEVFEKLQRVLSESKHNMWIVLIEPPGTPEMIY